MSRKKKKTDEQNLENSRKRWSIYIVQDYYCSDQNSLRIFKEQIINTTIEDNVRNFVAQNLYFVAFKLKLTE